MRTRRWRWLGWVLALGGLTHCEEGELRLGGRAETSREDAAESALARPTEGPSGAPPGAPPGAMGWMRQEGGIRPERLHALAPDGAGGFVAAGLFGETAYPHGTGLALARYGADGGRLWTRVVTNLEDVHALFLGVTPRGQVLVVGRYSDAPDLGTGPLPPVPEEGSGLFIAALSATTGQTEWARGYTGTHAVRPTAVALSPQGQLVVVGDFQGTADFGGGPRSAGPASLGDANAHPGGFLARFNAEGIHLWSRTFESRPATAWATARTVAIDAAGHVLVGGRAAADANLGDGALERSGAFIAKYHGASGALLWKRLIPTPVGEVVALRAPDTHHVLFNAHLGGDFTFGGAAYSAGAPGQPDGYTGTMTSTGGEVWLRSLGRVTLSGLDVGPQGTRVLAGQGLPQGLELGTSGPGLTRDTPFVARLSPLGDPLWSRALDGALKVQLAPLARGALVVGGEFSAPLRLDTQEFTPRGGSDLLFFQLQP